MTFPASLPHKRIAVIGGGPSGLIAAEKLAEAGHAVEVFERMPTLGRKFLMAGRGGLNLTHVEPLDIFLTRYAPATPALKAAIRAFPPEALRAWADGLGQETFAGTSGRVFPKAMKASPLLRAWLGRLEALGVKFHLRHTFEGWNEGGELRFATPDGPITRAFDAVILALGGASWPRLGSDGAWVKPLAALGVPITPLRAANAGVLIGWSDLLVSRHAGCALKRIALRFGDHRARGEVVITKTGLEGGAVYALSRALREAVDRDGHADLTLDLRPDIHPDQIVERLAKTNRKESFSSRLRKAAGLQPNAVALVNEVAAAGGKGLPKENYTAIAKLVTALPLRVTGMAGLDRAISTAGGVDFAGLTPDFMLNAHPGVFVAGEMLDWEAPTGGYLLQASFASGVAAAEGVKRFLG
jgi:uncharacterized flavoprotein (TIGR03862 family)